MDVPDKLYAEPASAFVHEFLGESVRFDCMVSQGRARIPGLPDAIAATDCPPGPAIALIRPHEIGLRPGPGSAHVDSVHASGPLRRVRISLVGQTLEVLCTDGVWTPAAGESCNLDLSRARVYSANQAPLMRRAPSPESHPLLHAASSPAC